MQEVGFKKEIENHRFFLIWTSLHPVLYRAEHYHIQTTTMIATECS
jgi:hypothetical protein